MDNKTYHIFTSKEGGQISYYFTDSQTDELAAQDATKAAVKYFNNDNPVIEKLEHTVIGLPHNAKAANEWFIGVEDMFAEPRTGTEESTAAASQADVKKVKSERKVTDRVEEKNKKATKKKAKR